ncbi:MAG: hypothetical protein NVV74_08420 [Magnetospirillum sp.]|nr:hypothetical protein [Magnetospirillum sp.]
MVSALLRLSEFEEAKRRSRQYLRLTGWVLPIIGATFAGVTFAMFKSGIVNFQPGGDGGHTEFFMVIGFLSGFSERFTRGLLGAAETSLTAGKEGKETGKETGKSATGDDKTDPAKKASPQLA